MLNWVNFEYFAVNFRGIFAAIFNKLTELCYVFEATYSSISIKRQICVIRDTSILCYVFLITISYQYHKHDPFAYICEPIQLSED